MKLTIEIPEQMYQNAKKDMLCGSEIIINAIKNGTPIEQEPKTDNLDKTKTEIEQVKAIMNEEIIEHNRKDLINFINGIQELAQLAQFLGIFYGVIMLGIIPLIIGSFFTNNDIAEVVVFLYMFLLILVGIFLAIFLSGPSTDT